MTRVIQKDPTMLAAHTTMRVGGRARYFYTATHINDLYRTVAGARSAGVSYFILGGGSNIIVSDAGFDGLVVKVGIRELAFKKYTGNAVLAIAGAGVVWDDLVAQSVAYGLSGIETLSLIPGTVGAAPVQNIGAYGAELADTLAWVEALDVRTGKIERLYREECAFSYRSSIFKRPEGKHFVIVRVALMLTENGMPNVSYADVAQYLHERRVRRPRLQDVRSAVVDIRTRKLPSIEVFGTAGSFFKNPIIPPETYERLRSVHSGLPGYRAQDGHIKVSLAWILDHLCGWRGFRHGQVGVYHTQPLALINFGGATAEEIMTLARAIEHDVRVATGIAIEMEVMPVGVFR